MMKVRSWIDMVCRDDGVYYRSDATEPNKYQHLVTDQVGIITSVTANLRKYVRPLEHLRRAICALLSLPLQMGEANRVVVRKSCWVPADGPPV